MKPMSFLLVDDDASALKNPKQILKDLGHEDIQITDKANDAWLMMRIMDFGCIISAWEMPEMNGMSLLKIVRNDDKLYIIPFFLTHSAFTEDKVILAGQSGVTGLIVKPFDGKAIENKLSAIPEDAYELDYTEAEDIVEQGLRLIEKNNYESALNLFRELTQRQESAEIYYNIGYIKTVQKLYEEAIIAFRKAVQLDRLFAKAYEAMGRAYQKLGRNKEAQECFQKAADLYLGKERIQDAEALLNEIKQIDPDSINIYNSLGVLYRKKGDVEEALKNYQKALTVHPEEPYIHYNIGRLYLEMENLEKARFHFKQSLRFDPNFQDAAEVLKAVEGGISVNTLFAEPTVVPDAFVQKIDFMGGTVTLAPLGVKKDD